jgi:hypothetical protein
MPISWNPEKSFWKARLPRNSRDNPDVKEFYMGITKGGGQKIL